MGFYLRSNRTNMVVASVLTSLTLLVFTFLTSSLAIAEDSSVEDVEITVPASCTLSTTSGSGETYQVSMQNGQYKNDVGETTINTFCNTKSSFAIYAIGYSDDTYGNTDMITTNQGATSFPTGTATSGATSNWAMKLESVTASGADAYTPTIENGFGNFSSVPSTYTQVAKVDAVTGNTSTMSVKASYAIFLSQTQGAGTYTGKVRYTAIHPASEVPEIPTQPQDCNASNRICYWPNGNGVTDNMGDQSANANTSTMLWPTNFKRGGYGFAGWSDQHDYKVGATTNTGHIYGPMETITTPADMSNGLSLYAVWVKSAGNLQGWNGCSSLASGAVTALTDTRDNNTYAVAKLADGKCWMIENLRLADKTSNNVAIELSSTNTNNPSLPLTNNYSQSTTSDSLSASQDPTQTAWCATDSAACDDQSMLFTGNTTNPVTNMTAIDTSTAVYSYGNYYNWYSVTAGNGTYSTSTNNSSVSGDICPAGWHLPKGGDDNNATNSDFRTLAVAVIGSQPNDTWTTNRSRYYNVDGGTQGTNASKAIRTFPNNFLYSGFVYGSSVYYRGSSGYYWSSTVGSSSNAYGLNLGSSYVYPGTNNYVKYFGFAARCVAGN